MCTLLWSVPFHFADFFIQFIHEVILKLQKLGFFTHKNEKLNDKLRKSLSLSRKILTLHIDPLPCEHPLKSSVPFWSVPFRFRVNGALILKCQRWRYVWHKLFSIYWFSLFSMSKTPHSLVYVISLHYHLILQEDKFVSPKYVIPCILLSSFFLVKYHKIQWH